jgi:predicted O-methyltransferase YrrM
MGFPGPAWILEEWMSGDARVGESWDALLFLTGDENLRTHREALALLVERLPGRKVYLLESHFILMDLSRHARTPAAGGRRHDAFFYVEPSTWLYLHKQARKTARQGTLVEIGTFTGGTTLALGLGSKDPLRPSVVTVDPIIPRTFLPLMRKAGLESVVIPFEGRSSDLAARWTSWSASEGLQPEVMLLFVDGSHEYECVLEDLALWGPHIPPGGRIVAHDYFHPLQPGVARAVEVFLAGHSEFGMEKDLADAVVCLRR